MNNTGRIIIFLFIFLSIYIGAHYYIARSIIAAYKHKFSGPHKIRRILIFSSGFIVLGLPLIIWRFFYREPFMYSYKYVGYIWMGFLMIAICFFIFKDIIRLIIPKARHKNTSLTTYALIATFVAAIYGAFNEKNVLIKRIDLKIPKLQKELKIVQLTDLHLLDIKRQDWLREIVIKVNDEKPDFIFITGDLIDGDVCKAGYCEILKSFKSKYGTYAISGNHEYYAGLENFIEASQAGNFKIVKNECIVHKESGIAISGIDDSESYVHMGIKNNVKKILAKCPSDIPNIFLSHRPENFNEANGLTSLQLSGHTHGGQLIPGSILIYLLYKYPYGLYEKNNSYVYTSSGTGGWGPPMRILTNSEIVVFNLKPAIQ